MRRSLAALYRQACQSRAPLIRLLTDLSRFPFPKGFAAAAEFVLNQDLRAALEQTRIDRAEVTRLFQSAKAEGITLDVALWSLPTGSRWSAWPACLRHDARWPQSATRSALRAFF